jgi:hypothetical protein
MLPYFLVYVAELVSSARRYAETSSIERKITLAVEDANGKLSLIRSAGSR